MATAAFIKHADTIQRNPVVTVVIDVRSKGGNPAITLRISDREYVDPDGKPYNDILRKSPHIDAGGSFLDTWWNPVDCTLDLKNERLSFQGTTGKFADLLSDYDMPGSTVTIKQGFTDLSATSDLATIFVGEIAEPANISIGLITFRCVQDRKWVKSTPPDKAERNTFPDLPRDSVGTTLPIVIGNFSAGRRTLTDPSIKFAYLAGISRGAHPMLTIDSGANGNNPKYLWAATVGIYGNSNETALLLDRETGRFAGSNFVVRGTTDGETIELTDADFMKYQLAILGVAEEGTTNADNWLESSREDKAYDLEGFSLLDFDAGKKILRVDMPEFPEIGEFVTCDIVIWYAKNISATTHPRWGIRHVTSGDDLTDFAAAASSTYPSDTPIDDASQSAPKIASWADIVKSDIFVEVRLAGQKVQIHRINIVVTFRPRATIIKQGQPVFFDPVNVRGRKNRPGDAPTPLFTKESGNRAPDLVSGSHALWTQQLGVKDDGSGTYTGSADSLIEHPADAIHWMLVELGGLTASDIKTAAGFGSFVDARTSLASYKSQIYISEEQDLDDLINDVGKQFLLWSFRGTTQDDNKFLSVPLDDADAADYRTTSDVFKFGWQYIVKNSLRITSTPIVAVRNIIRVNYDYDIRTKSYAEEVFITATDSRGSAGTRDQNTTAPDDRESQSSDSVTAFGEKEYIHNMRYCSDAATAADVRERLFDLLVRPRVVIQFRTHVNAADLERGQRIEMDAELDDLIAYPGIGSNGSWSGKVFFVVRATRLAASPVAYSIEAVEV